MVTVIFYCSILLISVLFVWLSEKGRTWVERCFFLGIAFSLVFIPSAIRYDIGTDYLSYVLIFEEQSILEEYKYKEPGFYFVNWLLGSLDLGAQWAIATFALVFTATTFKSYPKRNAWLLHFLFFSILWYISFNVVRQAVALSFCLLALSYYFNKRYFLFLFLTVLGGLFHQTGFFITAVGLAAMVPLQNRLKTHVIPFLFIGLIVFATLYMGLVIDYVGQILKVLGMERYASYFYNSNHFISRDFGSGIGILVKVLFSIYVLLNTRQIIQLNERYWVLIILIFFYALGLVLASYIVIFERMVVTFIPASILSGYVLFELPRNRWLHRSVLAVFMLFLMLSFVKDGMGIETAYGNPKLNPYQTVFSTK